MKKIITFNKMAALMTIARLYSRLLSLTALSALPSAPAFSQLVLSNPNTSGIYTAPTSIVLGPGFGTAAGRSFSAYITPACAPLAYSLSAGQNYIVTYTPRTQLTNPADPNNNVCDVIQTIQYFDGLGRLIQTVNTKGSPRMKDLVLPAAYDAFGRQPVKYLPYAATTGDGSYKPGAVSDQLSFYAPPGSSGTQQANGVMRTTAPFAVTGYEPGLLNRMVEQGAPGTDWQLPGSGDPNSSGHTIRQLYLNNDQTSSFSATPGAGNLGSHIANLYTATINSDLSRTLSTGTTATYLPGRLAITITRDENWQPANGCVGTTEEYKDMDGHIVLKRTYNSSNGQVRMLSTYYVYDELDNLCFVLPPGSNADAGLPPPMLMDQFCYQYRYDDRNRLVEKKIPGKGVEYTVYNTMDQVVATQDSGQRAHLDAQNQPNPQWTFTKYDAQGRATWIGLWNSTTDRASLQTTLNAMATNLWESRTTSGYTNVAWPTSGFAYVLTVNYYDDYTFPSNPYAATTGAPLAARGMLTAARNAVLNPDGSYGTMLWRVNYYDDHGRLSDAFKQHYLGGASAASTSNYDDERTTYNFDNTPALVQRFHYTPASIAAATTAFRIDNAYYYDHMARKFQTYTGINGATAILQSQLAYNEVGQLMTKDLHSVNNGSKFLEHVNYTYNERGWLSAQNTNDNLLALDLHYNAPSTGTPQFNGNIAELHYAAPGASRLFDYSYDALNRLVNANSNSGGALDETLSYDNMGNISSLARGGQPYGTLGYTYAGNQLTGVTGSNFTSRNYGYDANGNATSDGGNQTILYNILDLPRMVGNAATYTYDAAGNKLNNTGTDGSWDYIDGIVYYNGSINFVGTEEGRAFNSGGTFVFQYDLKDHLGDVRVTFDRDPATGGTRRLQEDEYYSFGLRNHVYDFSSNNRYLYNNKELQTDLANQYDYGARFYDPVIARWTTPDPLAETSRRHSPYAYGENNPIRNIDPDGMEVVETAQGTTYTGADAQAAFAQLQSQQQSQQNNKPKDQADDAVVKDPIADQTPNDDGGGKKNDGGGKKDGGQENGNVAGKQSLPDMKENPPNVPGYKPPKSGARKVRNPNGKGTGWVDRDGRVWVPDDHNGTHAPHWDVQNPTGGGYTPVYPTVAPVADPSLRQRIGNAVGLSGVGLTIYLIISEGSRLFPPRNLVPVP